MKVVVEFWTWRKLRCEEDEDGVERKWRRERKVKVGMCQNEVVRVLNEVSLG